MSFGPGDLAPNMGDNDVQYGSRKRARQDEMSSAGSAFHQETPEDNGEDSQEDGIDKKTGRRKIKIEFIQDKSRRHITFSKRKAGIMKKAYELSTLTGTQVLLLVVSETGLVYTFTTAKLQPLVTQPEGKNLIQACLNAPTNQPPPTVLQQPPPPQQQPQQVGIPQQGPSRNGSRNSNGGGYKDRDGADEDPNSPRDSNTSSTGPYGVPPGPPPPQYGSQDPMYHQTPMLPPYMQPQPDAAQAGGWQPSYSQRR